MAGQSFVVGGGDAGGGETGDGPGGETGGGETGDGPGGDTGGGTALKLQVEENEVSLTYVPLSHLNLLCPVVGAFASLAKIV